MVASDPVNPPTPAQKAAAQARTQQAQNENQQVQQQREKAPGSIQTGTEQEAMVRQESMKAEQQRAVEQNVKQSGSSKDQFAAAREEALKSGSFNYGNQRYAEKGTPASFVNNQGVRITRPQGSVTGSGSSSSSRATPKEETVTLSIPTGSRTVTGEQALIDRLMRNYAEVVPPRPTVSKSSSSGSLQSDKSIITKTPVDLRSELATLQGKASESAKNVKTQDNEAVSFLALNPITGVKVVPSGSPSKTRGRGSTPGTGQHVEVETIYSKGTENIPGTSLIDVLQYVPLGGLGVKAGGEALRGAGSIAGKTIKTGGEVVPKGIKPPEEKNIMDTVKDLFTKPQQKENPLEPSMQNVPLGRGTAKLISTGEKKGGLGTGSKPSGKPPGETPTPSKSGQVLEQVTKEKTEPKTNYLGQGAKQTETESLLGKGGSKSKLETQETIYTTKPGTKLKEETSPFPFVPMPVPLVGIVPPITTPKEKQEEKLGIADVLTVSRQSTGQGTKQDQTTASDVLQASRQSTVQTPKQDQNRISDTVSLFKEGGTGTGEGGSLVGGLGSGMPGLLDKVSKSGSRLEYTGNVPLNDIVGVYNREDVTYGRTSNKTTREKDTKMLDVFSSKKSKKSKL